MRLLWCLCYYRVFLPFFYFRWNIIYGRTEQMKNSTNIVAREELPEKKQQIFIAEVIWKS